MFVIRDIVPVGHCISGLPWACPRQDLEHPLEAQVLVHRNVAMPFATHLRGPKCACCPVMKTEGEVQAPGFANGPNWLGAPH